MSQEWLKARRPYAWSPTTDCTFIQQSVSDYVNKRLAGKPVSRMALRRAPAYAASAIAIT